MQHLIQAILDSLRKITEAGRSRVETFVKQLKFIIEILHWKAEWTIRKWDSDGDLYDTVHIKQNLLLNAGINLLLTLLCGGSGTAYSNANAYLGVGDGTTTAAATQTALQGTNILWKAMDTGYPTYGTSQIATFKSTFASAEGNFAWNEFSVGNGSAGGTLLNRKVSAQGTKVSGQTWELTLTITIA